MAEITSQFSVSGKTAIVTGAGSGINLSFAKLLLQHNCNVVIGDLTLRPEAQTLVDAHSSPTSSPRAIFVQTDVAKWPELDALFAAAESHFQTIDIVCPGAGVFEPNWSNFWIPPGSSASRDSPAGSAADGTGHYASIDINLIHPIRCTQLALSRWLNPANGVAKVSPTNPKRIVHVSSIAGQVPGFSQPLYSASKHALSGFVRSLELLEPEIGVRVNGVAPGIIKTPLWTDHPEKMVIVDQEKDEWVEPEEVALAMLECVQNPNIGGGVMLEVGKGFTRKTSNINDPGPSGRGMQASHREVLRQEALTWLREDGWGVSKI